jgi:hypothetical protein
MASRSDNQRAGTVYPWFSRIARSMNCLVGTVTLIGMCSGAVGFGAVAMDQLWVVGISGGSVERGNLTPDREAFGDLGSKSRNTSPSSGFGNRSNPCPRLESSLGSITENGGGTSPANRASTWSAACFTIQFNRSGRIPTKSPSILDQGHGGGVIMSCN